MVRKTNVSLPGVLWAGCAECKPALDSPSATCQAASASALYRCSLHWHFSDVISMKLKFMSDIYPKVLREGEL